MTVLLRGGMVSFELWHQKCGHRSIALCHCQDGATDRGARDTQLKLILLCLLSTWKSKNHLHKEWSWRKLSDFEIYYKAIIIKTMWFWEKDSDKDDWNRKVTPEIDPLIYGKFIFHKHTKAIQWGEGSQGLWPLCLYEMMDILQIVLEHLGIWILRTWTLWSSRPGPCGNERD